MALSGSFSSSVSNGKYALRVDWSATQSVTNNTSKITATMYLVLASGWDLNIGTRNNTTTIAGTSHAWTSPTISKNGGTVKLGTVTSGNISHNSDGTKSVTISATFNIQATISGTYYEKITASKTVTLNTIARATQPTLSASSAYMGGTVTINMPRASSSFTHDLAYSFAGSSYVSIATGRGTSYDWTVPILANDIPNATSGTVTIRCITKNGSTTIGTKTVLLTAKVPTGSDYYPKINSVTTTEQTSGLAAQFGAYIQNKSKIKATITAEGAAGSTIKSYSTTFAGKTYAGSSWTSRVITQSGSLSLVTTVTDSRGRTAKKTTTISVLAYAKPSISTFVAKRTDANGVEDIVNGDHVTLTYAYAVQSLGSKNTAVFNVEIKGINESTWTSLGSRTALSAQTTTTRSSPLISTDNSYDVRATLTDWFGSKVTYLAEIKSGAVIMDVGADGVSLGFGKVAEYSGAADFAFKVMTHNGETPGGKASLKTNDNLNNLLTPGFYTFSSAVAATVANLPLGGSGSSGSVQVIAEGEAGQVRQVVTRCSAASREIWERLYYSSAWQEGWRCVYKGGTGRVLWSGAYYMSASQTATLTELVSKQPNGIVLVFSRYSDGATSDSGFHNFFVSKEFVGLHPGKGSSFMMMNVTFDVVSSKYLYISDDKITGHDDNKGSGTGATGISYNNTRYVLRYVIGV